MTPRAAAKTRPGRTAAILGISTSERSGPAYWSSGGVIVGRSGPLGGCALQLFRFFAREALSRHDRGDVAAADCCLALALELAAAIVAASDWVRAASGGAVKKPQRREAPPLDVALQRLALRLTNT